MLVQCTILFINTFWIVYSQILKNTIELSYISNISNIFYISYISDMSIASIVSDLDRKVTSLTRAHQSLKTKVEKRFEALDRNDQLGCLIVQGKGLPLNQKNERLCDVLIQLAQQKLNIKIQTDDIAWIRRISVKKSAPILAK